MLHLCLQPAHLLSTRTLQDVLGAVNGDPQAASFLLHQLGNTQPASSTQPKSKSSREPSPVPQTGKLSNPNTPAATSGSDVGSGGDEAVDLYRLYRREANQATRQWQKALHSAARAYASGDHEGALALANPTRAFQPVSELARSGCSCLHLTHILCGDGT